MIRPRFTLSSLVPALILPLAAVLAVATIAALLATSRAAEASDSPLRLSRDVVPVFESIRLRLDADRPYYSGSVHVELEVQKATRSIQFHAAGLTLGRIVLRQAGDEVAVEAPRAEHGVITLLCSRILSPGEAQLDIDFSARYATQGQGMFRVIEEGRSYVFSTFEPIDARSAFPCWDEPSFKIPYQFTLEVPSAHEALTNAPIASQSDSAGWKTLRFARTPPLPSYLLALATGPLEFTNVPGCGIPVRIVSVQGQKHLAATAAGVTPVLLHALENWFGTQYPFAKLDLIAIPGASWAMENPGAITFASATILLDPATATARSRQGLAGVLCHEMAHMWFGDLVTMEWWDDCWLNESFADWMAAKIVDEVYPEHELGLRQLQSALNVMSADVMPSTVAIRDSLADPSANFEENAGLTYTKGNAVLSMFERHLGPAAFQKGVRAYLAAHARGNATAADLWKALDRASGTGVSAAMATFVDQPGVPFVRVTRAPGGIRLTQSRCTPGGISQPPIQWKIPLSIRWSDGARIRSERVLLDGESQIVKLAGGKPAWVMPNGGGHGYYVWSESAEMMQPLAAAAEHDLSPAERISVVGNLGLLLHLGEIHGDAGLRAFAPFGSDPEPLVVSSVLSMIESARKAFVPDSLAPDFAAYVRATLTPALDRFGMERVEGERSATGRVRGALLGALASWGRDERVMAFADRAAERYLADSTSVDPGIVDVALAQAARHGDAALFETYRMRAESARVPAIRSRFLRQLGAFDDPALETRALDYLLSGSVQATEAYEVLAGFDGKPLPARRRLLQWVEDHYDALRKYMSPDECRVLPAALSACSDDVLQSEIAFFGDERRKSDGFAVTLQRVTDDVHGCLSLRNREGAAVAAYLRSLAAK